MSHDGVVQVSDSFVNLLTGQRTKQDPRSHTHFMGGRELTEPELDDLYRFNGLAKRIVNEVPDQITRKPWAVSGDTDNDMWEYLDARSAQKRIRTAFRWARLKGGAVIVLGVNDGGGFESELNLSTAKSLEFLRVYDRFRITSTSEDWDTDPNSIRFGQRKFYTITPQSTMVAAATVQFRVHWSRVIELSGEDTPDQYKVKNQGFGESVLQVVYETIERYMTGLDDSAAVLKDFVQSVMSVKNLSHLMSNPKGQEEVRARLDILDLSRHVLNMMILDEGETYTKQISSVTGVSDILDRLQSAVASETGYPVSILFGKSPSGLNATGDSEVRQFYDKCQAYQSEEMGGILRKLFEVAAACQDFPKKGFELPATVQYAPLWQPTAKEEAETREIIARTDKTYIDSVVLMPEEVAIARFGGDVYSPETKLLTDRTKPPAEAVDPSSQPPPEPIDPNNPNPDDPNAPPPDDPAVKKAAVEDALNEKRLTFWDRLTARIDWSK